MNRNFSILGKALFATLLLLFSNTLLHAQTTGPQMADAMRSNGKIYVVVSVVATIFAGIFLYLIRLDRKISKLENHK